MEASALTTPTTTVSPEVRALIEAEFDDPAVVEEMLLFNARMPVSAEEYADITRMMAEALEEIEEEAKQQQLQHSQSTDKETMATSKLDEAATCVEMATQLTQEADTVTTALLGLDLDDHSARKHASPAHYDTRRTEGDHVPRPMPPAQPIMAGLHAPAMHFALLSTLDPFHHAQPSHSTPPPMYSSLIQHGIRPAEAVSPLPPARPMMVRRFAPAFQNTTQPMAHFRYEPTMMAPEPIIEPLAMLATSTSASPSTDAAIEGNAASVLDELELVALSVAGVADADEVEADVQVAANKKAAQAEKIAKDDMASKAEEIANRGPVAPAATTAALSEHYAAQLGVWTDLTKPQRRSARKLLNNLLNANKGHALDFLRHEYDVVGVVARAILLHGSQEADRIMLRDWYPEYARLTKIGKSADELSDFLVSDWAWASAAAAGCTGAQADWRMVEGKK